MALFGWNGAREQYVVTFIWMDLRILNQSSLKIFLLSAMILSMSKGTKHCALTEMVGPALMGHGGYINDLCSPTFSLVACFALVLRTTSL